METLTPMAREKVMAVVNALPARLIAKGMNRPGKSEFQHFTVEIAGRVTVRLVLAIDFADTGLPFCADIRVSGDSYAPILRGWTAEEIELEIGSECVEFDFGGVTYVTDSVYFHAFETARTDHYFGKFPAICHRTFAAGIMSGRILVQD